MLLKGIQTKLKLLLISEFTRPTSSMSQIGILPKLKIVEKNHYYLRKIKKLGWFSKNSLISKIKKKNRKKKFGRYKFDLHGLSIEEATRKVTEILKIIW